MIMRENAMKENTMKENTMKVSKAKKAVAVAVAVAAAGAWASVLSPVVKPIARGAVESATRAEARAASKAALHAGASRAVAAPALAAVEARRAQAGRMAGKLVTPKNLVAAGVGTAAVVGTHEVADGLQSTLESSGRAIEEHPEAAGSIIDSLVSPVKWLAVAVFTGVAAFLVWLFWPFVLLVVRGARLLRARMAKRLAEKESGAAEPPPAAGEMQAARSGRANCFVLVAVACFCLLAAINVWRFSTRGGSIPSADVGGVRSVDGELLRAEFSEEVRRSHADFVAEVNSVAASKFGAVRSKIPSIVKKYGAFSCCCSLAKSLVADKMKGGHETQDKINADLEQEYYAGIYSARDALADCVRRHGERLGRSVEKYRARLGVVGQDGVLVNDDAFAESLARASERIEAAKANLSVGQVDAAVSMAIEAVCVRQTIAAVSKALGRVAAREAGAVAVGAGAAVADGPLPFIDILAATAVTACTIWSVRDVYKAAKVLPRELEAILRATVDKCERDSLADVVEMGEKLQQSLLGEAGGQ